MNLSKDNNNKKPIQNYIEEIETLKKSIIFQDENLVVINKPNGYPVQGGSKVNFNIDLVLPYLIDRVNKPRLVHRIDKDTTGILVIAKTKKVASVITSLFKHYEVKKKYFALVIGTPASTTGNIKLPLKKKNTYGMEKMEVDIRSKSNSETFYKILESKNNLSLIELMPKTGRKHQIRVHMQNINHPILGDKKYFNDKDLSNQRNIKLHLHAKEIDFYLNKKRYLIKASLPSHFKKTLLNNNFNEKYYE